MDAFVAVTKAKCNKCDWQGKSEDAISKEIPVLHQYKNGEVDVDIDYEPECPKCGSNEIEFS